MTTTVRVHVNGQFEATVKHDVDGQEQPEVVVGPQEEKMLYFRHGATNTFVITEKPVEKKAAE